MEKAKLLMENRYQPRRNVQKFFIVMGALHTLFTKIMPICTYIFSQFLSTVLPFSFIRLSFLLLYFRCYILTEEKVYVWCYINWRKLLLLPIHNFIKRAFHLERTLTVIRKQMSLLWFTVSHFCAHQKRRSRQQLLKAGSRWALAYLFFPSGSSESLKPASAWSARVFRMGGLVGWWR